MKLILSFSFEKELGKYKNIFYLFYSFNVITTICTVKYLRRMYIFLQMENYLIFLVSHS